MERENKNVKISFIGLIVGFVFICNPNINIIDFLPDFVGYIIITLSLSKIAALNEALDEARNAFIRMIYIDAAKILAIFWTFGISVSSEYTSSLLLWSFVFCVLEIVFACSAFSKLFAGLMQIGNLYPNEYLFKRRLGASKSNVEKLKALTLFFVSFKALLSFLPELSDLSNSAYDEGASGTLTLYQYIGILRLLCFVPVLILGIVWILRSVLFFAQLNRDTDFVFSLSKDYSEKILCKNGFFIKRAVKNAFLLLIFGAVLTVDFRLDSASLESFNYLPDFLPAVFFILYFVCIRKYITRKISTGIVFSAIYCGISFLSFASEIYFFGEFSYSAVLRSDTALISFNVMVILEAIKGIIFVLIVFEICKTFKAIISEHTGYVLGRENVTEVTERQANALHRELGKYSIIIFVTSIVYVISDVTYKLFIDTVGIVGIINFVCCVAFVLAVLKAQIETANAVNTKYMLD